MRQMLMHAAPVTGTVTFPISWLSSVIVNVLEMVPRISAADAVTGDDENRRDRKTIATSILLFRIPHLSLCSLPETTLRRSGEQVKTSRVALRLTWLRRQIYSRVTPIVNADKITCQGPGKTRGEHSPAGISPPGRNGVSSCAHSMGRNSSRRQAADGRHDFDPGGAAGPQLMNAPSSPGRTWSTLDPERGLRALAAAVPATVCLTRRVGAGISVAGSSRVDLRSPTYECDASGLCGRALGLPRWSSRRGQRCGCGIASDPRLANEVRRFKGGYRRRR